MATDATTGLTELVQALHARIADTPTRLSGPLIGGAINGITGLVYGGVLGVTRAVGSGLDVLLAQLGPVLAPATDVSAARTDDAPPARVREAVRAALNGVLGDYLEQTGNPLAIPMAWRRKGVPLALAPPGIRTAITEPRGRVVVLVHGLCMNDLQWERSAEVPGRAGEPHDHGAALERDLGVSSIYLHYNSGLHVSTNGRRFADQLEGLLAAWPVPVEDLAIVGHSMGGLLARSAWHYGTAARHAWPARLRSLVFLGTPHHGSPLERGGQWIDVLLRSTPWTAPFERLGRVRSAGITDLRHGSTLDEDWHGSDRFAHGHDTRTPLPLPDGVACFAIAATKASATPATAGAVVDSGEYGKRVDALPGDGLVPVASALGRHDDPRLALEFPPAHQCIAQATGHLELLSSPAVYAKLREWLADVDRQRQR